MDSKYLIIQDIPKAKEVFKNNFPDIDYRILIGEKLSKHIFVKGFAKTNDGQIIIEIPGTLKSYQDNISVSQYAGKLKTKEEIWPLLKKEDDN